MKKTFTLWLMLLVCISPLFATDYLIEDNEYLLNYFNKSGTPSEVYLNCEQEVVTTKSNKTITFTYGGNLTWYNMQVKALNCWYVWSFGKFDIHYKLFYKAANQEKYTLGTEGTHYYIDNDIALHEAPIIDYKRNVVKIDKKPFENTIQWTLPNGLKEGTYQFMLLVSISASDIAPTTTPTVGRHYENGANNIFCKYESAIKHINGTVSTGHTTTSNQNRSGGIIKIEYVNSNKSVIQGNSTYNPLNEEGYRLVYNHPDAIFNVSLTTDNTPVDTIIDSKKYHGYSTFICGVGESYQIPSTSMLDKEIKECQNNQQPNYNNLRCIELVKHSNPTLFSFIKNKYNNGDFIDGASQVNADGWYGIIRPRGVLLQSVNQAATLFNENAISKLSDYEKTGTTWFTRTYHVRDLEQVKFPNSNINDHNVFKVWNKMHYSYNKVHDVTQALGCSFYGPSYNVLTTYGSNKENYPYLFFGQNCLMFKLVPKVYFPTLSTAEQEEVHICATEESKTLIHLVGKSIVCPNTSPTVYSPLYFWQISTNGVTWRNIADNDPNRVNADETDQITVVDSKDLLLKSTILKNDKPLYFRQLCVLKSFASTEESALYNYPIEVNGKTYYYISVASSEFYTYRALSKPMAQNFGFMDYEWPTHTYLCPQEELQQKLIQFDLVKDIHISDHEINLLKQHASYDIYQIDTKGNKTLVSQKNTYNIPALAQDTTHYQCVISLCGDSLSKDIYIYRFKPDNILLSQLSSTAAIAKADSINNYVQLLCLNEHSPSITIKNNNVGNVYEYKAENSWQPFTKNIEGTTLLPYVKERPNPSFYIRKTNVHGCVSDTIKIDLKYVQPITGNIIEFKHTASDTVFVPSGQGNPYIIGSYPVSGGYGDVNEEDGLSYTYQWMRKSTNGEWEPIIINSRYYAQVTDSGTKKINSSTKYVSLPDETLKDMQENWEIARFVYSRKNGDEKSQIVSISNSLWMLSSAMLSEENIQVFNAECPHEKVSIVVNEPDELINKNTRYIWSASDPKLVLSTISTQYSTIDNKCIIQDANSNFTIRVYRYDTATEVRSNTVEIPISVDAFNTGFSILYNLHEYGLDEKLVVPPGSKIQLINQTVNADEHLNKWVLQLQENYMGDGRIVEGATSTLVNPSCYLYNLGQHKIKLTTTSKNGCNETVLAENIYVEGAQGRAIQSYFETEDTYQIGNLWLQEVFPTLLNAQNGYTIQINTNKKNYPIALYNVVGQTLIAPFTANDNYQLSLHALQPGYYLLQVDGTIYKIFKQ